jgi:hypothetical protein
MALAEKFGISEYPAPAGGCILADPILSRRIKGLYGKKSMLGAAQINKEDVRSLLIGRQLALPRGGWLIIGRDERDNDRLAGLAGKNDALLMMEEWPGPSAILKKINLYPTVELLEHDLQLAASLIVRYSKKVDGRAVPQKVICDAGETSRSYIAEPFEGDEFQEWVLK